MAKKEIISSTGGGNLQNAELAGIPDSPIFTRDREEISNPVLALHVGGVLVSELPLEMQGRILYQQTDEGIAEWNAGKQEAAARVTKDSFTKTMEHRKDAVRDMGMDINDAPNPMKELMDKHVPKGMRGRFLSPRVIDRRGMRGWEPVTDESGAQVKVRDTILAQMPEEQAKERGRKVREYGNKLLGQVKQQYLEEGGQSAVAD